MPYSSVLVPDTPLCPATVSAVTLSRAASTAYIGASPHRAGRLFRQQRCSPLRRNSRQPSRSLGARSFTARRRGPPVSVPARLQPGAMYRVRSPRRHARPSTSDGAQRPLFARVKDAAGNASTNAWPRSTSTPRPGGSGLTINGGGPRTRTASRSPGFTRKAPTQMKSTPATAAPPGSGWRFSRPCRSHTDRRARRLYVSAESATRTGNGTGVCRIAYINYDAGWTAGAPHIVPLVGLNG